MAASGDQTRETTSAAAAQAAPPGAGSGYAAPSTSADSGSGPASVGADSTRDGAQTGETAHARKLQAARAEKLKAVSAAASAWALKSGKQTAVLTATASRNAAANVRSLRADSVRRVLVTITVVSALAATAFVAGFFDGPDIRTADLLRPDLTLVSPNQHSLYIWAVIGLGMVGYVVHQWLPAQSDSPRHRRLGWVLMVSLLLNLGLALVIQADLYVAALALHGVLLILLLVSLRWLNRWSAATRLEGTLVDVPFGLFLGWTGFTALSHTAAVLSVTGFSWLTDDGFVWALVGLGIAVVVGSTICSMDRGRMAVALALAWGLGWVIVERLFGEPASMPVAAAAALAVFILLVTAGSRRHRVDHSYRRALRRRQTANLPPITLNDDDDDYYEDDELDVEALREEVRDEGPDTPHRASKNG